MRCSLGRLYPGDIQNTLRGLAESLDDLMASSVDLAIGAYYDAAPEISSLNVRFVNDAIIVSDRVSDDEARKTIFEIQKEITSVERLFMQYGVRIQSRLPVPTVSEANVIRRAKAEELLAQFRHAFDMYPSVVDRYETVQAAANAVGAIVPVLGPWIKETVPAVGHRLSSLDQEVVPLKEASDALETALSDGKEAVEIAQATFARMRNLAAGVFQVDEALKRPEAASGKKAEPTPSAREATKVSWGTVTAIVGVVAVSGILTLTAGGR